jgi:putative spermidine/putrescine transport system permease protein
MIRPGERALTVAALAPGLLFLVVFFVVPTLLIVQISTWRHEPGALMRPDFTLAQYRAFLGDPFYLGKIVLTLRVSLMVTAITLALALPLAYWLARARFAGKGLVLGLVLSPLLTNFVVLVFAWIVLLGDNGAVNRAIAAAGLPTPRLLYSEAGVVIALVHISLPYALIPLLAAVAQVPRDVESAALSLGARPWRAFFEVVLPLCAPGMAAAAFVTVSIVLSGFTFALLLGGDNVLIVPLLIWQQVTKTLNWPLGAAMSVASLAVMLALLVAGMWAAGLLRRRRAPA